VGIQFEGCYGSVIRDSAMIEKVQDAYVLCFTSEFNKEMLGPDFGDYCVEISDGVAFFSEVSRHMRRKFSVKSGTVGKVFYANREWRDLEEAPAAPAGFVKPTKYDYQKEVRMLWHVQDKTVIKPEFLELPQLAPFCRRVA
jgi:hypothetical protein